MYWIWVTNLDYYATFYWIWTENLLESNLKLDTLLALDLEILGLRIWITIIIFYGTFTWIWIFNLYGFILCLSFDCYFILLDQDLKILGLQIWITIKFGLNFTGFGLGNTWAVMQDYD